MTDQESPQDVLKAISDKLAELEDMQLVNKLDIINVKNELDRASLSGGPSIEEMDKISELRQLVEKSDRLKKAERFSSEIDEIKAQFEKMKKGDSAGLRRDFDAIAKEFEELKKRLTSQGAKGATAKLSPVPKSDLEELRRRIGKLESAHPASIDLELPEELREEISKISGKVSALEKAGSTGRMENVEELSGRMESILKAINEQKERIDGIESSLSAPAPPGKAPKAADVPAAVDFRLDRLEKKLSDMYSRNKDPGPKAPSGDGMMDELSRELFSMKARIDGIEKDAVKSARDVPAGGIPKAVSEELQSVKAKVEALEKKSAKAAPAKGNAGAISEELFSIKARMDGIEKAVAAAKTTKVPKPVPADDRVDALSEEIRSVKAMLAGIKASKAASAAKAVPAAGRDDAIYDEVRSIKARVDGIENAAKTAKAPNAAPASGKEELPAELAALKAKVEGLEAKTEKIAAATGKQPKGKPLPGISSSELSEMRERMGRIEKGLEKASKIAMGLKPIELPQDNNGPAKGSRELELRIKDVEKAVGAGVGEERFKSIEKKMEEMREWLPEYIDNKVDKKLTELNQKVSGKVKEIESLKKELIDSTIEQMLAQPSTVSRMMGDKIRQQVEDVQEKMKKFGGYVKPSDAKLTSLMREIADMQKEMARMREETKSASSPAVRDEMREIELEIKTLSTRLDSATAPVKPASAKPSPSVKDVSDIQNEVAKLKEDMGHLKSSGAGGPDGKSSPLGRAVSELKEDIGRMKDDVKALKSSGRGDVEEMGIELKALAAKLESLHRSVSSVEESGVSGVLRDLEILKTKADWLESTMHKLDVGKIYERMEELEGMVRVAAQSGGSGPIILE